MLQLHLAAALESGFVTIFAETEGIPKADRSLNPQLAFEGAERRSLIHSPVAPGASCEAVLEEHADDGHHGKSAIGDFCIQAAFFGIGIIGGQEGRLPPAIARD